MTDYTTWPVIGKGTERTCYLNPADKTHLVKISPRANAKQTLREISYFGYLKRKGVPFDHLPRFYGKIEGEGFIGIEQELIRDTVPSGKSADMFTPPRHDLQAVSSPTIDQYLSKPRSSQEIREFMEALAELKSYLLRYNIIPCDLLPDNIVVKHGTTGPKLILIDGLGGTELIPVSNYFKVLGNRKILRKWEKFSKKLSAKFQQLDL